MQRACADAAPAGGVGVRRRHRHRHRQAGSRRWLRKKARARGQRRGGGGRFGGAPEDAAMAGRKRVMVVVDHSSGAKHAMMCALNHVANRGDVLPLGSGARGEDASALANSLVSLCKACKPEVRASAPFPSATRLLFFHLHCTVLVLVKH
ncbi:universal stress protein family protein [Hordeum vulgare]|nr:universal stress protein family protein [Hordeum vulgare]